MSSLPCRAFREQLECVLRGNPDAESIQTLSWHEHLLGCEDCRALLEAEEALEELLSSLPAPRLPRHLAKRVLARLIAHREGKRNADLDVLLDLDRAPIAPSNLASRVLLGLSSARGGDRLDVLLDLVPPPPIPADLSQRILSGLDAERRPAPRLRRVGGGRARRLAAAAVVLAVGLLGWRLFFGRGSGADEDPTSLDPSEKELIAALDVLQRWDLLMSEDPNLQLASISPLEEVLYEAESLEEVDETETDDGGEGG